MLRILFVGREETRLMYKAFIKKFILSIVEILAVCSRITMSPNKIITEKAKEKII